MKFDKNGYPILPKREEIEKMDLQNFKPIGPFEYQKIVYLPDERFKGKFLEFCKELLSERFLAYFEDNILKVKDLSNNNIFFIAKDIVQEYGTSSDNVIRNFIIRIGER